MLLKLTYRNHLGEILEMGDGKGVFVNSHDLRDYKWNYNTIGDHIRSFNRRGVTNKTLPIIIVAPTESEALRLKNLLFTIAETDILSNVRGEILLDGYSYQCNIFGSKFSDWHHDKKLLTVSLSTVSDANVWTKELSSVVFSSEESDSEINSKKYNYGYSYGYRNPNFSQKFYNNSGIPLQFKITIDGECENPSISIGGHIYGVAVGVAKDEKLVINSIEQTVYKIGADGSKINCFDERETNSYIFEPIKQGESSVTWSGISSFTLTPIIERSTPEWL